MQTQATATGGWDGDDGCDFETQRIVTVVDDGFEKGAALDGHWIWVRSQQLRSGRVNAMLAGVTVDLRGAVLGPEGATIEVQSVFSGIEFLVPGDWEVDCEVDTILSGVSEQRWGSRSADARPRLRITGMVVAGGLSLR